MHTTDAALVKVEQEALEQDRLGVLPGQCGSFTLEMTPQESKCKQRERERDHK